MKMKRYIITTGEYDNFDIMACIEGPITPALSTLKKAFFEEFNVIYKTGKSGIVTAGDDILANIIMESATIKRMKKAGYGDGFYIAEAFIDWLIANHNFQKRSTNEFHI